MVSPSTFHIHHVSIQTGDFEKAYSFYTEILNLGVVKEPFTFKEKRILAWLNAGSIMIELYSVKKGEEAQGYDSRRVGPDHLAFEVVGLRETILALQALGVHILKYPFLPIVDDENQPEVAFIEGPDGEEIELREKTEY